MEAVRASAAWVASRSSHVKVDLLGILLLLPFVSFALLLLLDSRLFRDGARILGLGSIVFIGLHVLHVDCLSCISIL